MRAVHGTAWEPQGLRSLADQHRGCQPRLL